jgi:hypothetical protein
MKSEGLYFFPLLSVVDLKEVISRVHCSDLLKLPKNITNLQITEEVGRLDPPTSPWSEGDKEPPVEMMTALNKDACSLIALIKLLEQRLSHIKSFRSEQRSWKTTTNFHHVQKVKKMSIEMVALKTRDA